MTTTAAGLVSTTVSTDQLAPLGFELEEPASAGGDDRSGQGPRIWVYVQNNVTAATAWLEGTVVTRLGGATTHLGIISAAAATPNSRVMGVAQHAIPAGSFGFVLKRGIGEVLAGVGTLDINEAIVVDLTTPGTAMEADTLPAATDFDATFGFATENAVATALATCWLNCPGG